MNLKTAIACLLLGVLSACPHTVTEAPPTPAGGVPSNLVLKSYDVPPHAAQRLRGVLRELLWFGSEGKDANRYVGRADVGPDGRLVVLAPEAVHAGVKALVDSVVKSPGKEPDTVRLTYWVVSGVRGEGGQAPDELKEVAAALKEIELNDGPMNFSLVEKLVVSSLSNERGNVDGRDTNVRQFATVTDGSVVADIDLKRFRSGQRLETRVRLKPGALVVLASSGQTIPGSDDDSRTNYFLVRASDGSAGQ